METDYALTLDPATPILLKSGIHSFTVGSGISKRTVTVRLLLDCVAGSQLTSHVFSGLNLGPLPLPYPCTSSWDWTSGPMHASRQWTSGPAHPLGTGHLIPPAHPPRTGTQASMCILLVLDLRPLPRPSHPHTPLSSGLHALLALDIWPLPSRTGTRTSMCVLSMPLQVSVLDRRSLSHPCTPLGSGLRTPVCPLKLELDIWPLPHPSQDWNSGLHVHPVGTGPRASSSPLHVLSGLNLGLLSHLSAVDFRHLHALLALDIWPLPHPSQDWNSSLHVHPIGTGPRASLSPLLSAVDFRLLHALLALDIFPNWNSGLHVGPCTSSWDRTSSLSLTPACLQAVDFEPLGTGLLNVLLGLDLGPPERPLGSGPRTS